MQKCAPVAVPGVRLGDGAPALHTDRGHSLRPLHPPPAALPSLARDCVWSFRKCSVWFRLLGNYILVVSARCFAISITFRTVYDGAINQKRGMMYPYSIYAFDYDEKGYIPMQIEAMKQNSWQGLEIRNVGEYNIVDITVGIYGDIADRWLELHRQLPELKGVFDPANFVQCGDDTLRGGQTLKAYTYHYYLHIKDALPNANAAFNAVCGILKDILEVL